MVERPRATDNTDTRSLSRMAKLIIGGAVFALGVLAGAAVAAWVMPPS